MAAMCKIGTVTADTRNNVLRCRKQLGVTTVFELDALMLLLMDPSAARQLSVPYDMQPADFGSRLHPPGAKE